MGDYFGSWGARIFRLQSNVPCTWAYIDKRMFMFDSWRICWRCLCDRNEFVGIVSSYIGILKKVSSGADVCY